MSQRVARRTFERIRARGCDGGTQVRRQPARRHLGPSRTAGPPQVHALGGCEFDLIDRSPRHSPGIKIDLRDFTEVSAIYFADRWKLGLADDCRRLVTRLK